MAVYYWVGGAGTWDNTNTAGMWKTTSGGATNAPNAPLAADTATFDANSGTGAVSIAATATCATCTFGGSGITATLTANHTVTFTTLSIASGTFDCSTFNHTITTLNHTGGTFTCNGGTITSGTISSTGAVARTINLNASTLILSSTTSPITFSGSNLTFNVGTSQINITSTSSPIISSTGVTFYNVSFTSVGLGTATINGANTFNNLSFASKAGVGVTTISLGANQIINGTLTIPAPITLGVSRYFIQSDTLGTTRTLTATTVSLNDDIDFRDITISGTAWSGTRFGNCGGNTNITFPSAKTVYWNLAGSNPISSNGWATTQTGTPARNNFPLPQDTAIFTDTSPVAGSTITFPSSSAIIYNLGTVDFSTRTNGLVLAISAYSQPIYGNFTLSSAISITQSSSGGFVFFGRNITQNITSSGVSYPTTMTQSTIGGGVVFLDAYVSTNTYTLTNGSLSTNYNITSTTLSSPFSTTRSLSLGAGTWTLTGTGTVFNTAPTTGLTVTGTPTFNVTNATATATTVTTGVGVSNLFNFNFTAGTYALTLSSGSYFNNLDFTGYAGTCSGTSPNIYGNLTLSTGMTATSISSIFNGAANQTVISNGKTLGATTVNKTGGTLTLNDALTSTGAFTLTAGSLNLGVNKLSSLSFASSGAVARSIDFSSGGYISTTGSGVQYDLSGSSLTFIGTSDFRLEYTGATASTFSSVYPTANFKVTTGTYTLSPSSSTISIGNIDFTGFSGTLGGNTSGWSMTFYGNVLISSTMTVGTHIGAVVYFAATSGIQTLTTNGKSIFRAISINGGGTLKLLDALTSGATATTTLTSGTLDLNDFSLTTGGFTASGSTTRTLSFGSTGMLNVTGTGPVFTTSTTTGLTVMGNPVVMVSNSSATATTVTTGTTVGVSNLFNFNFTAGTYTLSLPSTNLYGRIDFTGFAGTCSASGIRIYGDLTLSTGMTSSSFAPYFYGSSDQILVSNAKTFASVYVNKTGGTLTLNDAITVNSNVQIIAGSLSTNYNVTTTYFASGSVNSLSMGSGTWTLTGTGTIWSTVSGLTLTAGTSKIALTDTSATARTFAGGGKTYNNLEIGGTTGISTLTFTGSNTFNTISSTKTVAHTILFTAGTTTTVANWTVTGTAGNIVTIGSVTAAQHFLVKTGGGDINVDYMNISWSNAT